MFNNSLQVCHCGWSKITTYHGLRTHQGKMGCTVKGMRIPEDQQFTGFHRITYPGPPIKIEEPFISKPYHKSDTLDIALTIPQDLMRYALQGLRAGEVDDSLSKNHIQPIHQNYRPNTAVKQENVLGSPNLVPQTNTPAVTQLMGARVKTERKASQMGTNLDKTLGYSDFTTSSLTPTVTTQMNLPSPQPTVNERSDSFFQTPQCFQQTTSKSRRALDFSTWEQQNVLGSPNLVPQTNTPDGTQLMGARVKTERKASQMGTNLDKTLGYPNFTTGTQERMKADLQQEIDVRQDRMVEVRSSERACRNCLDAEWLQINDVFSSVMKLVRDACQKALQPLEDRRREVEREAESLVQNLQREIATLEQAIGELNNNSGFQVSSLTSLETNIDTSLSFGTLRAATSTMMSEIQQELEKLTLVELRRIPTFAVDVKLDPATAHRSLLLSPDGKKVQSGNNTEVANTAERFDMFGCVLGLNSLISGRAYWEVEVANKSGWDLGVTRRSANRTGKLVLNPDNGYWVAVHYEDKKYAAMTAPPVRICLKEKPKKVGVFVDYEEGLVSFYDVTTQSHVYSFTECSFADEIRPYFSPHHQNEKNQNPLVICAA